MVAAEEDIRYLIQIVQKDQEISRDSKLIGSTPAKIEEIDRKAASIQEDLKTAGEAVEKIEAERRSLERKIQDQRAHKNDKQVKMDMTKYKSNADFQAAKKEIAYLNDQIYKEEERVLELMELLPREHEKLNGIKEKAEKELEALAAEKKRYEKELEEARKALETLREEKIRILPNLSDGIRRKYERILKVKGDSGVANLLDDVCQGCFSRIPMQKAVEVRRNDTILTCEVCGRILVYYTND